MNIIKSACLFCLIVISYAKITDNSLYLQWKLILVLRDIKVLVIHTS